MGRVLQLKRFWVFHKWRNINRTPPCFLGTWMIMIIHKNFNIWITVMIFFDKTILIWMTVKIIWHWGPIVFPHVENGSATPDTHPPHTLLLLISRLSRWITNSVYLTLFCASPSTTYTCIVVSYFRPFFHWIGCWVQWYQQSCPYSHHRQIDQHPQKSPRKKLCFRRRSLIINPTFRT